MLVRFTATGALDPNFGDAGQAIPDLPPRTRVDDALYVAALAVAPSGQILVAGGSGDGGVATVSARLSGGAPDLSFGSAGAVREERSLPSINEASGLAISPSGKMIVSARSDAAAPYSRGVLLGARRNGAPDREVGEGAGFTASDTSSGVRVDGSGRFYALVYGGPGRGRTHVARFDGSGRPDLRYGADGAGRLPRRFAIWSLAVRRSGEALVVGHLLDRPGMAAFELTPRGRPDHGFGHDGLALAQFGEKSQTTALAACFDRRGRVVLFGNHGPYAGMARLLPNGHLDPSFAHRGRQPYMPALADERSAVAMAPDGGILVAAGAEADLGPPPTTLIRFRPDGIRDRSFGHNGVVRVHARGPMLGLFGGNRILLVSGSGSFGERGVAVRAFARKGHLDRRFGHRGLVVAADSRVHRFRPAAAARQADGRLVVVGSTGRMEESGATVELLRFR